MKGVITAIAPWIQIHVDPDQATVVTENEYMMLPLLKMNVSQKKR